MKLTKLFALIAMCLTISSTYAQDLQTDYSLARVGKYIYGVYIFIECTPAHAYDHVGTAKKKDFWTGEDKSMEKIIEKAQKKNPYFDGIIMSSDKENLELIKFKSSSESSQGFALGDKVSFMRLGKHIEGEIVDIENGKDKVVVKFTNAEGEQETVKAFTKDLNRL